MATSVRIDPATGLPATRVISPVAQRLSLAGPMGPPKPSEFLYGVENSTPGGGTAYTPHQTPAVAAQPAAAPTPAPAGGGGGGGGGFVGGGSAGFVMPDYKSLVAGDAGLQQLRASLAAGNISAAQFRTQAIQRALIAFGRTPDESQLDPNTKGFYGQDVTQLTKDLAAKNTAEGLSTTANLDRDHKMAVQNLQNVLAARGMLQSGGLGVGLGLEGQRDKSATTKATSELIDYLSGQAAAYAQHINESKQREAEGIMSTAQGYMSSFPPGRYGGGGAGSGGAGGGGGGIGWDPGSQANVARAGYDLGAVEAQIQAFADSRGWGINAVKQEGSSITNGGLWVKFETPQGSSTEFVPIAAAAPPGAAPPSPTAPPVVAPPAAAAAPVVSAPSAPPLRSQTRRGVI